MNGKNMAQSRIPLLSDPLRCCGDMTDPFRVGSIASPDYRVVFTAVQGAILGLLTTRREKGL